MTKNSTECTFPDCLKLVYAKKLCRGHYHQAWSGKPLKPLAKRANTFGLSLQERFAFYVDTDGECHLWTGAKSNRGYGHLGVGGRQEQAHRVAYKLAYGEVPQGLVVDHWCHTPACVNPTHLRAVTIKQNMENQGQAQKNSKSGVRGVYWNRTRKKWVAQVMHNGKVYFAGYFEHLEDAGDAAAGKRMELFTHSDGR